MAGGSGGRNLEETPTWAVAVVCFSLLLISIFIEHIIHLIGKWLKKKHKRALYESLEKIKSELMLMGFISLLLSIGQGPISRICISEKVAGTWQPCSHEDDDSTNSSEHETSGRRLLAAFLGSDSENPRRVLEGGGSDNCAEGKVPFVSSDGIHQLHIFIFVLAVFHVLYCFLTMALGGAKMRRWKRWEEETKTFEYQFSHDPERFRFARDTSFGRRHLSFWTKNPVLIWIVCFFRQFVRSVPKVDYLTLRHGFIMAHLAPQSHPKFDFRKYIKRSLEEDFKVVVGISPPFWFFAVLFLLFNTYGWYSYLWLPFIPLIIILLVGTKLQVIITEMGLSIQQRGEVLKGVPVVQPGDHLFWFNRPRLILYLINFVLFQNAFQLAFFSWTVIEENMIKTGTAFLFVFFVLLVNGCGDQNLNGGPYSNPLQLRYSSSLCSCDTDGFKHEGNYIQRKSSLGSTSLAPDREEAHKENRGGSLSVTPMLSRPTTPTHSMSPVHLLRYHRSEMDRFPASPRGSNLDTHMPDTPSPSNSTHHHEMEMGYLAGDQQQVNEPSLGITQHEIVIAHSKEFSFDKRTTNT